MIFSIVIFLCYSQASLGATISGSLESCAEVSGQSAGAYTLQPLQNYSFKAYCYPDRDKTDRPWTVILYRSDNTEDFDREYCDYAKGFGKIGGQHWLGLNHIFFLTNFKRHEVWIQVSDKNNEINVEYDRFAIGSRSEGFNLHTLGLRTTGTGVDNFRTHMGMRFSTKDKDFSNASCPLNYHGGWWFYEDAKVYQDHPCADTFLTGVYTVSLPQFTFHDFDYNDARVKKVLMAIREYKSR